ncbi:hypothetical protein B0T24DRAFT_674227 [Lasiosphaeria ovina]|uniref:Uncharacterized protein n=1 Tax=Lasiosphaeria ovina TaxID=92902 RepID=A0AAE0TYW0_9PEZI|nr:hypothetical protein B0T24DRAFT_674227 [Lasiosphaeria ovina]
MADFKDDIGWYVWFTELSIVPPEYRYILRIISGFFITLALAPIIPVILLVIYDFSLWLWRLYGASHGMARRDDQKPSTDVDVSGLSGTSIPESSRINGTLKTGGTGRVG